MYRALVHTVPGSGTRFVCQFAEKALKYKRKHTHRDLVQADINNVYCHTHVHQHLDEEAADEHVRVITPIRHPYHTYLTRRYRVGPPSDPVEVKQKAVALHWSELVRKSEYMGMLFVPIEEGFDRAQLLHSIADRLGTGIKDEEQYLMFLKQWPKVGTAGERPERVVYDATGLIDGKVPHFLDFAVEWYEGIILSLQAVK